MAQFQKHNKDGTVHTRLGTPGKMRSSHCTYSTTQADTGAGRSLGGGEGVAREQVAAGGEPEGPGVRSAGRPAGGRTDGGAKRRRTLPSPRLLRSPKAQKRTRAPCDSRPGAQ
ncbi:hypothetical protein VULLAG_LOCUS17551 [Vulpes lagopus]